MIVFKYKEELLEKGTVLRPVADVYLKTVKNNWLEFHPYIDSGADITMIPLSFGELLGWQIDKSKIFQTGGIRGSVPIIYKTAEIRIGEKNIKTQIAWALLEEVPPLLGRKGVFDKFDILFKQRKGEVIFS